MNQNRERVDWSSQIQTCGKSLLAEGQSESRPLQVHVHSGQGAPLVHELHGQSGGVRGAVRQLKLCPQRSSTWGSNVNI